MPEPLSASVQTIGTSAGMSKHSLCETGPSTLSHLLITTIVGIFLLRDSLRNCSAISENLPLCLLASSTNSARSHFLRASYDLSTRFRPSSPSSSSPAVSTKMCIRDRHYREIVVVDPRYYFDNVDDLIASEGITDVLFLYNANTFFADDSLSMMFQ